MAPYAIAHLKIGLKLYETGYRFGSEERARIYLTNALEPAHDFSGTFEFAIPALAHEAAAVNEIKRHKRFTVVIGNPPYSNRGQLNRIPFILNLLQDYKRGLNEQKINLDDDFIKFLRLVQWQVGLARVGIVGLITNNTYTDGITHRRLRESLLESFSRSFLLDLHGSSIKKESAPDGSKDENVFDITLGVAIGIFLVDPSSRAHEVFHSELWGVRERKYEALWNAVIGKTTSTKLEPRAPDFFFVPRKDSVSDVYQVSPSVSEIFLTWQNCLKTDRDELFFDFDRNVLVERIETFYSKNCSAEFKKRYRVAPSSSYNIERRRDATRFTTEKIIRCLHRPFDKPWLYYDPQLTSRSAWNVMSHMLAGPNLALITCRQ